MDRGVSTLLSGMMSEERKLEFIANNLANVNTIGFKRQQSVNSDFSTFMHNAMSVKSPAARKALQMANRLTNQNQDGTTTAQITTVLDDGPLEYTGNSFDLALSGEGFFTLDTPDGIRYTRNGQFSLNGENFIVNQDGYLLLGQSGPIQFEGQEEDNKPTELIVDKDGNIFDAGQNIGALRIAKVDDPTKVLQIGDSLYISDNGEELPDAEDGFEVSQGSLELSNVSAIGDMTQMIEVQRTFETYQKIYQQYDQLVGKLIDEMMKG